MTDSTYRAGPYTVRLGLRPDNPAFPVYLVYRGSRFIGKSFSYPDEGCCRWIERQRDMDRIVYAESSAPKRVYTAVKRGRPTNAERAKRLLQSHILEVAEEAG